MRKIVFADTELEVSPLGLGTAQYGTGVEEEEAFRQLETAVIREAGKESGCIITTGGGCVTQRQNYPLLHQNGRIVWVRRALDQLPTAGRPLSRAGGMERMYEERKELYAAFADITVSNDTTISKAADRILKCI